MVLRQNPAKKDSGNLIRLPKRYRLKAISFFVFHQKLNFKLIK